MTDTGLQYVVYTQKSESDTAEPLEIQAMSGKLTVEDANLWRSLVSLNLLQDETGNPQETVGLFNGLNDDFILARRRPAPDDSHQPNSQYVNMSRQQLQALIGNLHLLLELTARPLSDISMQDNDNGKLPSIELPETPTWTPSRRKSVLEWLSQSYSVPTLLYMLDCALTKQRLIIRNAPRRLKDRLDLVEGLMMLVPSISRPDLTFTTHAINAKLAKARITFSEIEETGARHVVDLQALTDDADYSYTTEYTQMLAKVWHDDLATFMTDLRALDIIAGHMLAGMPLLQGLNVIAARYQLNKDILADVDVPIEAVIDALSGKHPPLEDVQTRYIQRLLAYALDEREPNAVALVATYMDQEPRINAFVYEELKRLTATSPDDVYFFVRLRLSDVIDEQLLSIFHDAAEQALQVALGDGVNETLLTWLNLIAREPDDYQLGEVLNRGITAAQSLAHENGPLGADLVLFVAKRTPEHIDTLLDDPQLFATMGPPIGPALRDYAQDEIKAVLEIGREVALVLLGRAAQIADQNADAAAVFDTEAIDYLWAYYTNGKYSNLPLNYQPDYLLNLIIEASDEWLTPDVVELLVKRVIAEGSIDLLMQLAAQINETYDLVTLLVTNFQINATASEDVLTIVRQLQERNIINAQQAVDIHLQLAAHRDWHDNTRILVERVTRMVQQNTDLDISLDALWQMLRIASGANKMDAVANVVTRRTLAHIEHVEDEGELVDMLLRLHQRVSWSKSLRVYLLTWWRDFIHDQPLSRIQQLDRNLNGKKELADERAILETTIAVRRMLGQRNLTEFAADLTTTYNVLQAISESFDPTNRAITHFDLTTVRAELEASSGELSADERQVLAKNLKELAQLIISMSDLRSKPAIMRREEDVERQLIVGDQTPQSGIDTMRWLSGYLNGSQPDKLDNDDE